MAQPSSIKRYFLGIAVYFLVLKLAQSQKSPCPNIFTYTIYPGTDQVVGFLKIRNIQVGQVAQINLLMTIQAKLPTKNVGSIFLIKSREATFNDIVRGEPAKFLVNFPLKNILPTVVGIKLNGRTICQGRSTIKRRGTVTTINLEHKLFTQLASPKVSKTAVVPYKPRTVTLNSLARQPQSSTSKKTKSRAKPKTSSTSSVRRVVQSRPTTPRPKFYSNVVKSPTTSSFTCGRASSAYLNKLSINGLTVDKGQFPWIVPLFDRTHPRSPQFFCGSTIISDRFLITAAHCVFDGEEFFQAQRIMAVPGMYNIDNFFDDHAQIVDIDRIIPNEEYIHEDDTNDADIAVLRLKSTLEFTEYIIPICPWQGENDLQKIVGQEGIVAGWGLTQFGAASTNPTYVRSRVVDRWSCIRNLNRMYPKYARIFCGDGEGSVPCNGDSGSGLVIKRGNQYYLRGVVSKGLLDPNTLKCDAKKFAIFTDIAPFRFWLRSVTKG
ncbi:coagulation factor IX-like [Culex quinquefasciatus]|uniref:coagulation factor IX-like n=1 Tax=Culex quinquefasciatus TaxID=7176 RepID=UPI0018E2E7E3|nr:coagulation factor IX-like [Culex quinquefasciatus]